MRLHVGVQISSSHRVLQTSPIHVMVRPLPFHFTLHRDHFCLLPFSSFLDVRRVLAAGLNIFVSGICVAPENQSRHFHILLPHVVCCVDTCCWIVLLSFTRSHIENAHSPRANIPTAAILADLHVALTVCVSVPLIPFFPLASSFLLLKHHANRNLS